MEVRGGKATLREFSPMPGNISSRYLFTVDFKIMNIALLDSFL